VLAGGGRLFQEKYELNLCVLKPSIYVQMHGSRAVMSVCNLRLLDLNKRLMSKKGLRSKPCTDSDHPAGLYLWQNRARVGVPWPAVSIHVTTGRTEVGLR